MQAKPFNQHSPHYEKFFIFSWCGFKRDWKAWRFHIIRPKNSPKLSIILKNQPDGDLLVKNNVFETDIYAYQFYYSDNWDDYSKEKFNELDFGGDMYVFTKPIL